LTKTIIWYLQNYLISYLDQETATLPIRSSGQAATWYYQPNHSKVQARTQQANLSAYFILFL